MLIIVGSMEGGEALKNTSEQHSVETKLNSTQVQENVQLPNNLNDTHSGSITSVTTEAENTSQSHTQRRLLQTADKSDEQTGSSKTNESDSGAKVAATVENSEPLDEDADASFDLFRDPEDLPDEYNYDYDDYVDDRLWGDEDWKEQEHEKAEDYVSIDAHILSTPVSDALVPFAYVFFYPSHNILSTPVSDALVPFAYVFSIHLINRLELLSTFLLQVIADIDKDGVQEMVIAVSYFFDHE